VAVMLRRAEHLAASEREAFRDYQRLDCRDCDFAMAERRYFFESSTNLITRVAKRFPNDARTHCALGEAQIRNASLGEGNYDVELLRAASPIVDRAAALARDSVLQERIRHLRDLIAREVKR
jgi:hypothetical protein